MLKFGHALFWSLNFQVVLIVVYVTSRVLRVLLGLVKLHVSTELSPEHPRLSKNEKLKV